MHNDISWGNVITIQHVGATHEHIVTIVVHFASTLGHVVNTVATFKVTGEHITTARRAHCDDS